MNPLEPLLKAFSGAFDAIINTQIYYKSNRVTLLQAGIIALLPQVSAYVLESNKKLGIQFGVNLQSYPLLLFMFLVVTLYVLVEPRLIRKKAEDVFRLVLLSIHLFAFALSINLIYLVVLQLIEKKDLLAREIEAAAGSFQGTLHPSVFAAVYGVPFLIISIAIVFRNSFRLHAWRMRRIAVAPFFWRTFFLSVVLALYQYMAFILVGASAVSGKGG